MGTTPGARVIGTGRAADRDTVLELGADAFLDLSHDLLKRGGPVETAAAVAPATRLMGRAIIQVRP
uniref:hypothetical protein n=1 Tax=Paractinoplanes polyasparticus TaxID=2856853 RepID=UPI001C8442C4|nr:hypothetical protein [Actinoplanes polyasparticus]